MILLSKFKTHFSRKKFSLAVFKLRIVLIMNRLLLNIRENNKKSKINVQLNEENDKSGRELISKENLEIGIRDYILKVNDKLTKFDDENLEIAGNSGFTIYARKKLKKKNSKSNLTQERSFLLLKID
jgi:hypothetical protein